LGKYFRIKGGHALLFGGMDSRFRGNDIKRSGNGMKEIFKIILNSLLQLEEKWDKIGS